MSVHTDTPARMRRVAAELGDLRRQNGLRAEEVAAVMGFSLSKLSRMENGRRGLRVDDVSALLGLYRVPAQRREELLAMVRTGHERNWWRVSGDLPPNWRDLLQFEAEATAIYNWEPTVVPGLLQTAEYAEAIIRSVGSTSTDSDIQELVTARMDRQARFACRDTSLSVLIDEMALRRRVGGAEVMRHQLERLVRESRCERVRIQVVPFDPGEHAGMSGPFMLMEFPKDRRLVYLEGPSNSAFLEERVPIQRAQECLRRLRQVAWSQDDSVKFAQQLSTEMT